MRKTVRGLGGKEMQVQDRLRFTAGDIVQKKKHHSTLVYFIVGAEERGEYWKYKYFRYEDELFGPHHGSGWHKADYFEKRIDTAGEEEKWVDYDMGSYEHVGHIKDVQALISLGGHKYFTISFRALKILLREGFDSIGEGWDFYQTSGDRKGITVVESGRNADGLADDMLRLSDFHDDGEYVEHQKRVMEAVNRGIWIPIKSTDAKVNGKKVSHI